MSSSSSSMIPCGQFKTDYRRDTTIFPTPMSRGFAIAAVLLLCIAPLKIGSTAIGYQAIADRDYAVAVGSATAQLPELA